LHPCRQLFFEREFVKKWLEKELNPTRLIKIALWDSFVLDHIVIFYDSGNFLHFYQDI